MTTSEEVKICGGSRKTKSSVMSVCQKCVVLCISLNENPTFAGTSVAGRLEMCTVICTLLISVPVCVCFLTVNRVSFTVHRYWRKKLRTRILSLVRIVRFK